MKMLEMKSMLKMKSFPPRLTSSPDTTEKRISEFQDNREYPQKNIKRKSRKNKIIG